MSYLKETALDWFKPTINDPEAFEEWMFSWLEFVHQLKVNFGPSDPVGDAEEDLDHLKMKKNQKIAKYNVKFNCLAAQCKWGEAPPMLSLLQRAPYSYQG